MVTVKSAHYKHCRNDAAELLVPGLVLVFLFLQLFFSGVISANEPEKVVFCSINKKDSRLYQISESVLSHAFNSLGIQFEQKTFPPKRISLEMNSGNIDGDAHRIYDYNLDNRYPNLIRVDESIQTVDQSVFTKLENITVDGWKSLSPYRVIYLSGIVVVEKGLEEAGVPPENRMEVYDIDNAFNLMNLGRGDLVVVSPSTGQASLKKLGITDGSIKMLYPPVVTIKLYPYMHKKHAVLAKKLADKILEMKKNGQYDEIISAILKSKPVP